MQKAILNPLVSVGHIKLGDSISNYPNAQHEFSNTIGDSPYHGYSFTDIPVLAYTDEEGKIDSLHCSKECIWQDTDLIGLDFNAFKALCKTEPNGSDLLYVTLDEGEQLQEEYDFDEFGLLIWVFNHKIVTVQVVVYEEE